MGELGKVYRCLSKKEDDKAVVVSESDRYKTCLVEFVDSKKTINITLSTLHNQNMWIEDTMA